MNSKFELSKLIGKQVNKVSGKDGKLEISLSDNAIVNTSYWRLLNRGFKISRFDHNQKYGLPEKIDAVSSTAKTLEGKVVTGTKYFDESGDLELQFDEIKLQIFNFSGYEIWEVDFGDGTGQYSNYV